MMGRQARDMFLSGDKQKGLVAWKVGGPGMAGWQCAPLLILWLISLDDRQAVFSACSPGSVWDQPRPRACGPCLLVTVAEFCGACALW